MSKMVYIAGPVTGRPDRNRSAFEDARLVVGDILGLNRRFVAIPHDLFWSNWTGTEARAMEMCLSHICCRINDGHAMTVVVIDGWRDSLGTAVEVALARKLGVPVVELVDGALIELESVILCTDKTNECPRCGNSGEHSNPGTSDQEGQRG